MAKGLSPTHRRILVVLADGETHKRKELIACLYDSEQASGKTLACHLSTLRKLLRPLGEDVVAILDNSYGVLKYRHVILLNRPSMVLMDSTSC